MFLLKFCQGLLHWRWECNMLTSFKLRNYLQGFIISGKKWLKSMQNNQWYQLLNNVRLLYDQGIRKLKLEMLGPCPSLVLFIEHMWPWNWYQRPLTRLVGLSWSESIIFSMWSLLIPVHHDKLISDHFPYNVRWLVFMVKAMQVEGEDVGHLSHQATQCTFHNMYEYTGVHERGINLNFFCTTYTYATHV